MLNVTLGEVENSQPKKAKREVIKSWQPYKYGFVWEGQNVLGVLSESVELQDLAPAPCLETQASSAPPAASSAEPHTSPWSLEQGCSRGRVAADPEPAQTLQMFVGEPPDQQPGKVSAAALHCSVC